MKLLTDVARFLRALSLPGRANTAVVLGMAAVGVVLIFMAAYGWRYTLGGDAIAYISIANYYAEGSWDLAVNGYWSPMISWLSAIFIKLGMDGQLAFMMVNAAALSAALVMSMLFLWKRTGRNLVVTSLLWLTTLPFYLVAVKTMNPDTLLVAWLVLYVLVLVKASEWLDGNVRRSGIKSGIALGVVGAVGYFAKLYALPVFVAVLLLWTAMRVVARQKKPRKIFSRSSISFAWVPLLAVFTLIMIISPWVAAMSNKYDRFMAGSSFARNTAGKLKTPEQKEKERIEEGRTKYVEEEGVGKAIKLGEPPHDRAVISGEDPTPSTFKDGARDVQVSSAGLRYYMTERFKAFPYYVNRIMSIAPFILPVMMLLGAAILFAKVTYRKNKELMIVGLAWFVYFGGYAAITSVGVDGKGGIVRYYWPLLPLAVMVVCLALPRIWRLVSKLHPVRKAVFVALVSLMPLIIFTQYAFGVAYPFSVPISKDGTSLIESRRGKTLDLWVSPKKYRIQEVAEALDESNKITDGSRILSNNRPQARLAAFHLESQSLDSAGAGHDLRDPRVREAAKVYNVDYFFHFASPADPLPSVDKYGAKVLERFDFGKAKCTGKDTTRVPCTLYVIKLPGN